jgi:hypothetical protein
MRSIEATLIREHMENIQDAVETTLYKRFKNFEVGEIVNEKFTLYGQMATIHALKPTGKYVFNYPRLARRHWLEMM